MKTINWLENGNKKGAHFLIFFDSMPLRTFTVTQQTKLQIIACAKIQLNSEGRLCFSAQSVVRTRYWRLQRLLISPYTFNLEF